MWRERERRGKDGGEKRRGFIFADSGRDMAPVGDGGATGRGGEVQRRRRRRGDRGAGGREGGGDSINWLRNSFAPGKVQPWNMPPQSDERSCGRETDHNGSRWRRKVDGVGVMGAEGEDHRDG